MRPVWAVVASAPLLSSPLLPELAEEEGSEDEAVEVWLPDLVDEDAELDKCISNEDDSRPQKQTNQSFSSSMSNMTDWA